ncbi:uncharacterized protein [Musca autumnalis]|uniref:uncharacterized protein n=1 Tax=Musca autumnalis TaxID=221902 RepID=UPI003CEBF992
MTSTSFNKIAFNCDVMIHIYKCLNFGDQLRLAQVDANLRSIFLQFISPISYDNLKVLKYNEDYIVSNDTDTDRILIRNIGDLEAFLQLYGNNVYDFSLRAVWNCKTSSVLFAEIPLRMECIKNIVKLKFNINRFTIDDMVQLANMFPNLEELQVHALECESEHHCMTRAMVKEILRLEKLKKFVLLIRKRIFYYINFKDFCEIVTKLPLEKINLKFTILFDSDYNELELQQSHVPLMQLKTDNYGIDVSFSSMLSSLRNLTILCIEEYCNEMANGLTQLHKLTISYTEFSEETNIILPPNLTTLHLISCERVLLEHLQKFLHENSNPKLIEFVAIRTNFRVKEFEELHISSRIKTLNIGSFDLNQFRLPFAENSALENLTLKTLPENHLAMDTLLNLRNLKKLSLRLTLPDGGFNIIRILQELPFLRELVIRQQESASCPRLQAVVTSVTCLKIVCFQNCGPILGFWLDMFSLNPQLELQLNFDIDEDNLQYLIQHERFPRSLRKIEICGFTVDCRKLRNNFESLLEIINYSTEDYENDNPTEIKCNIIMSRNKK